MPPSDPIENCFFRAMVLEEAAEDIEFQQDLWILCSRDPLFWVDTFCWTSDAEAIGEQASPFVLYPKQSELMADLIDSVFLRRSHCVVKARRVGVSWIGMAMMVWFWQFVPGFRGLLGSRTEEDVDKDGDPKSLFWKIDFLIARQPSWMRPEMAKEDRKSRHIHNPENAATIEGSTTNKHIGRGGGYTAEWIDEAASIEVLSDAMEAITHASRCWMLVSTPQGGSGAFYDGCQNAKKLTEFPWYFFPPQAAGLYQSQNGVVEVLDKTYTFNSGYEFLADGKKRSPYFDEKWREANNPKKIAQEMECAFLGSGWNFFPVAEINRLIETTARPPLWEGDLVFDPDSLEPIRLEQREEGPLQLWMYPDHRDLIPESGWFVVGSDIATGSVGRKGQSNSVNSVLNVLTGEKVAQYTTCEMPPEKFARLSVAMTKLFKGERRSALHGWDAGGPGHSYAIEVMDRGTGNVWYRRDEKRVDKRRSLDPGVYLNGIDVRLMVFDAYRQALIEGKFINRSIEALRECHQFVETPTHKIIHQASESEDPSGAGDNHGDRVIADLIAWWIAREDQPEPEDVSPARPKSCLGQRMKDRERELELATAW